MTTEATGSPRLPEPDEDEPEPAVQMGKAGKPRVVAMKREPPADQPFQIDLAGHRHVLAPNDATSFIPSLPVQGYRGQPGYEYLTRITGAGGSGGSGGFTRSRWLNN